MKHVIKDTVQAIKKEVVNTAKEEIKKQILGDTTKKINNETINKAGDEIKEGA